jgi:short-subunit dehydrogenase
MKIKDRVVLLTGASGGIGTAIANQLIKKGGKLILVVRDEARATEMISGCSPCVEKPGILIADLSRLDMHEQLIARAIAVHGRIDILINCAGIQNFGFSADESSEATDRLFRINTIAPIALSNALLPHMLARGQGQIVNLGSIFGSIGFPCFASYSASKFALRGYSEALRRELAGSGIVVSYVAPRFTKTPFNRDVVTRMANALKMNQDEPEKVAEQVISTIALDDKEHFIGWPETFFVRINALFPRLVDMPLMKQVARMRPFAVESQNL